ncbi:hypothetical protein BDZ89DRAFT_1063786 [Hymenopellis radicata]|nr:hypothetical protein BDZ89DRAFT_1063786 [Hymenopellis radicata]
MSEPEPILFTPRNGEYKLSDYEYVCKQQPLPMEELPEYLHTFDEGWTPPKLWLAWPSNLAGILKCVEKAYPNEVMRTDRGEIINTSIGALRDAVREEFVDPEFHDCVQLVTIALQNGKHAAALSVGCTHVGMLNENLIGEIQAKLGYEEPPQWYIDTDFWMWRERRSYVTPSRTRTNVTAASA